jgi:hypothetical protein
MIEDKQKPIEDENVEFKIVDDKDLDDQMPMFEIVKPSVEDSEPLEMTLLEKEAIEFELLDDEDDGISEDAIEVEPMEVEPLDESEDFGDGLEVEPLEVDAIEDEAEPPTPASAGTTDHKKRVRPKAAPKVKAKKKHVTAAKKPAPRAVPDNLPRTKPVSQPPSPQVQRAEGAKPAVHTGGAVTSVQGVPPPAPSAGRGVSTSDLIQDIETQLVLGSNCTMCGAQLKNPKFCTQCGAKVVISEAGVRTVSRDEAPAPAKPKHAVKRKVVAKK